MGVVGAAVLLSWWRDFCGPRSALGSQPRMGCDWHPFWRSSGLGVHFSVAAAAGLPGESLLVGWAAPSCRDRNDFGY